MRTWIPILVLLCLSLAPAAARSRLSDTELMDRVEQQTLRYFTDLAHPASGMALERNAAGDTVTTGGTGMGVLGILAGVHRGFVERAVAVAQLRKIVTFLEKADRYHGAWPHWLDGRTGRTRPFSPKDDGADLVETAFLIEGLLAVRQWADRSNPEEAWLATTIDRLWREVDWAFFTRGEDVIYWHWSPNHGWAMNLPIRGWNECLIVYVLAAASPTHPIPANIYHRGWAKGGQLANGASYEGIKLPLGMPHGGPLFFSHYSFLGLDPRGLSDRYADYYAQNRAHSLVNYRYCVRNPRRWQGYGANAWGLTASDTYDGYAAHSPMEDRGVISPTAALSAMPYTPVESMAALRHFYNDLGDKLFGPYGFYDAFCPQRNWYATTTLAIDQGPILVMIENYRSGLLWRLFMSSPEIAPALARLGFTRKAAQ